MDENFDKNNENAGGTNVNHNVSHPGDNMGNNNHGNNTNAQRQENADVTNYSMDRDGNMKVNNGGAAALGANLRTYTILGWVSAAFAAFISPYFAILGVIMGVLVNRKERGTGTAIIVTNIVLGVMSFIFRLFLLDAVRRMITGY